MASREALVDHAEVSSDGDVQDPEPINLSQEQVRETGTHSRTMIEWIQEGGTAC